MWTVVVDPMNAINTNKNTLVTRKRKNIVFGEDVRIPVRLFAGDWSEHATDEWRVTSSEWLTTEHWRRRWRFAMHWWATRRRGSVGRLVPPRRHDVGYPYPRRAGPVGPSDAFGRLIIISSIILDITVDRVLGRDARRSCYTTRKRRKHALRRRHDIVIFLLRFYHVVTIWHRHIAATKRGSRVQCGRYIRTRAGDNAKRNGHIRV